MDYKVKKWNSHVFQFQDSYGYCAALIIGQEKALLFDTMSGTDDLIGQIRSITNLPLQVINSHGHLDHTAGNVDFEKVYMNPADWSLIDKYHGKLPGLSMEMKLAHDKLVKWAAMEGHLCPILPKEKINLGGIEIEVISLAGHTAGSIGLYCSQEKLLLSGDAISPQMCMFFEESLSLTQYMETIENILQLKADYFMTGHHMKLFPMSILGKFKQCAELSLKNAKNVPYVYSINPEIKGKAYFLEYLEREIEEMICFIGKE